MTLTVDTNISAENLSKGLENLTFSELYNTAAMIAKLSKKAPHSGKKSYKEYCEYLAETLLKPQYNEVLIRVLTKI